MEPKLTIDLSELPDHGFGTKSLTWWGTVGMFAIESMTIALGAAAYLYLALQAPQWPPGVPPPDLGPASLFTAIIVLSAIPNMWLKSRAEAFDRRGVQIGLVVMSVIGGLLLGIRALEFAHLNVRWDTNAYGSAVWGLLGLHTVHLATDFVDTVVVTVLMFSNHGKKARRFVDTSENALYWNFVVLAWLPVYGLLYLMARAL